MTDTNSSSFLKTTEKVIGSGGMLIFLSSELLDKNQNIRKAEFIIKEMNK